MTVPPNRRSAIMGPQQPHSDQVHAEKYRGEGESFREAMGRIASGLSDDDEHFQDFREILLGMRFMPAGRIQAAIGSPKHITPYNCFVAATIHDSFAHGDAAGQNSIMDIAKQAAQTMRMGGGIGYDWSTLRPSDDLIKGVQSKTDGPLAFMPIMDAVCKATSSAGNRRGAQMGVLRIDHPDIHRFIRAKQPSDQMQALWEHIEDLPGDHPGRYKLVSALQTTLQLTGFNMSIAITDEFMECLDNGRPFPLKFGGRQYNEIDAAELWETVMRSTWDWAEPGVLFIDTINRMNNLYYCEEIAATNPCGEQPLPPHGACLLGSFNLTKYVQPSTTAMATAARFEFNMTQFRKDIAPCVRAMDNVVDYAHYPLAQQEAEAKAKRRMGLGITGLANAAEACGFPYGSPAFLQFERAVLLALNEGAYDASVWLSNEKGSFPLFDANLYGAGCYIRTLPTELQKDIKRYGIRNSHLTSIAPTGTISYAADNISSGLEPVFMYEGQRKMKTLEGDVIIDVQDYGVREFGVRGRTSDEVSAHEHVAVLGVASNLVDSAVSKTCNVAPDMKWDDFKSIYVKAHELGCKGATTFNPGGKRLGIFIAKAKEPVDEACTFDPETGRRNCE
jgi:ribonucleoside-diphosphate reductase alpha chain